MHDEFGRLRSIESASEGRKIDYLYDPAGRVIARTAWQKSEEGEWVRENRKEILERDGLPADVTFVWDPRTKSGSDPGEPMLERPHVFALDSAVVVGRSVLSRFA